MSNSSYTFTAEDIVRERDEHGLSWRQVAVNLDLANPGQARKAYKELTGVDHKQSKPEVKRDTAMGTEPGNVKMRSGRKILRPEWHDDLTEEEQLELIDRLTRSRITVVRTIKGGIEVPEEIRTGKVHGLTYETDDGNAGLTVHLTDEHSGGRRSFRVQDIKAVR